jgi:hypothetical protein
MTPVEGMTWVYDDIYMPGRNDPTSNISVIEVDMTENPYLHAGEVDEFVSGLSADDREARVRGRFVQIGGLVYKHFDPQIHVVDPFIPPKEWEWYASMDAGFNNPTAWLWHAVSPDGRVVTFDEHYVSGEVVEYHAKAVHQKNSNHGRSPDVYIGDPSIRNTDQLTGTSVHQEYATYGIPIVLGNNDVAAGVNRVASYLERRDGHGIPQLVITRNCVNLIQELQRYRWATYANKRVGNQNNKREITHKKDDHACDALRYFMMSRPDLRPVTGSIPEPPKNPLGAPSYASTLSRIDESFVPSNEGQTDWNSETISDEVMGGIW